MKNMIAVLVTTSHRGVFFGYAKSSKIAEEITLKKARMCIYWTSEVKGVLGLAVTGPLSGCRIGPAVNSLSLNNVDSITECSPQAVENWEKGIWQ